MAKLVDDSMLGDIESASLGWVGVDSDAPEVRSLRAELEAHNGLDGIEILEPHEVDRATQNFYRDGFVVVRDILTATQTATMQAACEREMAALVALDPERRGNRGSHRYSFGSASSTGSLTHLPEWAMLIDLPKLTPLLREIFESDQYYLRDTGGDFCLPGAVGYQPLHTDMGAGLFRDPVGKLTYRDLPCPRVACNFAPVPFTALNGPTRQIPGTQYSRLMIPDLASEPTWMKHSTVCPVPAGSVVIRDIRAWHGGTPNVSDHARAIPKIEFNAPWWRQPQQPHVPIEQFEQLSDFGRRLARDAVLDAGAAERIHYRADLGRR